MNPETPTLWIQPVPAAGCGGCVRDNGVPVCRSAASGEPCLAPLLSGEQQQLHQVMQALNDVVDPALGKGLVDLHLIKSLRLAPGEAELTVTFTPHCGSGQQMAGDAFDVLRRLLPDTDIFVQHAA